MSANNLDLADRSMRFERLLDAPRELVWQAWTDPRHVGYWWGPTGFSTTSTEIDIRSGGIWRFVMHGPDGRDYQNLINFIEVVPQQRLVYAHGGEGDTDDVNFHVTVNFESRGNKTQLTMQMVFKTAAELRHVIEEFGAEEGAHQHMDRLAAYLVKMQEEALS